MLLEIQRLLRQPMSPEVIKTEKSINFTRHKLYPNLVSFTYGIGADMSTELAQQCRGVVLDQNDHWNIVSRGFDKFFNYGEGPAAQIDWSTARVQEKLDGSLIMAYFYDGHWEVATTGTPDASGEVGWGSGTTFASLFWDTAEAHGIAPVLKGSEPLRNYTLMFELMTPLNRIVCIHEKPRLALIGLRHRRTQAEVGPNFANVLTESTTFPLARQFSLRNLQEILDSFSGINPLEQEGYVVADVLFRRIKVKHPQYVALHHIRSGASPKSFLEVIRSGEGFEGRKGIEALGMPLLLHEFDKVAQSYGQLVSSCNDEWTAAPKDVTRKEYAEWVKEHATFRPYLFARMDGAVGSPQEMFKKLPVDKLMRLLGLREAT